MTALALRLYIDGAIRFGYGVTIGGFLRPWGWCFIHAEIENVGALDVSLRQNE